MLSPTYEEGRDAHSTDRPIQARTGHGEGLPDFGWAEQVQWTRPRKGLICIQHGGMGRRGYALSGAATETNIQWLVCY